MSAVLDPLSSPGTPIISEAPVTPISKEEEVLKALSSSPFYRGNFLHPLIEKVKDFVLNYFKEIIFATVSIIPLLFVPQAVLGGVVVGALGAFAVPQYMSKAREWINGKVISYVPNPRIKAELSTMNEALTDAVSGLFHEKQATYLSTSIQCVIAASSIIFQGTFLGLVAGIQLGSFSYDIVRQINHNFSPSVKTS